MKLYKSFLIVLSTLLIMNCNSNNDEQLMEKAKELSQKFIITDGHIDTPWRMHKWGYEDISKRSPGDFDYVRAKEGGLDVCLLYTSPSPRDKTPSRMPSSA